MLIRKAYKFRLKVNPGTEYKLNLFAGHSRFVWNKALGLQKHRLENGFPIISYQEMAFWLVKWKASSEYGFLKEAYSSSLQQTLKDLDRATWDGLKKLHGMPKFKRKGKHDSFRFPAGFKVKGNRIYLPKLGWIKFRKSRDIQGTLRNVTISRKGKNWFVSIQTEQTVSDPVHKSTSCVGIDVGIKRFATLSNGLYYEPLNSFRKLERRLARYQKRLARKQKFSQNWKKQRNRISMLHINIADARKDYLHKISTEISNNHAMIFMEDLKIKNMSKSAKGDIQDPGRNVKAKSGLNKSILDQGWGEFKRQVQYKQAWNGGTVVFVPPRNTSKTCPECGCVNKDNRKTQANFTCIECGYHENADYVAALNILAVGHTVLACGEDGLTASEKQEPPKIAA